MLSFISLIIPFVFSIALYFIWNRKVVWWEFLLLFVGSFISVGIFKLASDHSNTEDTEFWNGTKQSVQYYEYWDEEVPCRHPKYCERYNSCKSRDSKGNCQGGMEEYQCGWKHAYDVDEHPRHWVLVTTIGDYGISEAEYNRLKAKWGNNHFVDMHRTHVHSVDGDMYQSDWNSELEKLESVTREHSYENRVQASKSVFNYPDVTPNEKSHHQLFEYPGIDGSEHQKHILGLNDAKAEHSMDILNGLLGPSKQLTAFVLVFKNKTIRAAELQEAYWKGGNKNEFVVCIGLDKTNKIQWTKIFSWCEAAEPKITIRNYIMTADTFNLTAITDYMYTELSTKFKRKHFKDFNYLTIPMTEGQIMATVITTIILNIAISLFVILNEVEDTDGNISQRIDWKGIGQSFKDMWQKFSKWIQGIINKAKSLFK